MKYFMKKMKITSLHSYITLVIIGIVLLIVTVCSAFFYARTSQILFKNQKQLVMQQLNQVNRNVADQVSSIDSINSMFLSNNLIRNAIEQPNTENSNKLLVEKQMDFLLISTYLWQSNYVNTIYIFSGDDVYHTTSSSYHKDNLDQNLKIRSTIPQTTSTLLIKTLEEEPNTLYFARNIYSTNTGGYIATVIIDINKKTWINHFNNTMTPDWFVYLYNEEMELITNEELDSHTEEIRQKVEPDMAHGYFSDEITTNDECYFVAAETIAHWGITSIVAAPQSQLRQNLGTTLQTYLWVLIAITTAALFITITLSQAITKPIQKMIYHINKIAKGEKDHLPLLKVYDEFDEVALALNNMLSQLNTYHEKNLETQMLLKNTEIHALQAQMDPHFLFNTLNTIAWKAQMTNSEEIYQMVISLGELLKTNVITKESTYTTLEDELTYVKFYTYLQKMRFEDKISVDIQVSPHLLPYQVPYLCIQPLVENAFVHGLETKKGSGRLIINIIPHEHTMEISVSDDGIGFDQIPDVNSIKASNEDTHTHIGLRNLSRRLFLLFGSDSKLNITSEPNVCTMISFSIPLKKEV